MALDHTINSSDQSAIAFTRIELREAVFRDADGEVPASWEDQLQNFGIRIEVRLQMPDDGASMTVFIKATVVPPEDVPLMKDLSVTVSGTFTMSGEGAAARLREFGLSQAPLLVWPYVRQAISNVTAQSRFGAFVIPPINMQTVLEEMRKKNKELADDTAAAKSP